MPMLQNRAAALRGIEPCGSFQNIHGNSFGLADRTRKLDEV